MEGGGLAGLVMLLHCELTRDRQLFPPPYTRLQPALPPVYTQLQPAKASYSQLQPATTNYSQLQPVLFPVHTVHCVQCALSYNPYFTDYQYL